MKTSTLVLIVLIGTGLAIMGLVVLRHHQRASRFDLPKHEVAESLGCAQSKTAGEFLIPFSVMKSLIAKGKTYSIVSKSEGCFREGQALTVVASKRSTKTHVVYLRDFSLSARVDQIFRLSFSELEPSLKNFVLGKDGAEAKQQEFDRVVYSNPAEHSVWPAEKKPAEHPMARNLDHLRSLVDSYKGPINLLSFPDVQMGEQASSLPKKIVNSINDSVEDPEDPKAQGFAPEISAADSDKVWVVVGHHPGDMRAYNAITQLSIKGAKYIYWLKKPPH